MSRSRRWLAIAAWASAYVSLLSVLHWSAKLSLPYLLVSLFALLTAIVLLRFARESRLISTPFYLALGVLALAVAGGGYTSWRLARLSEDWPRIVAAREDRLRDELDRRMEGVVERGRITAETAAQQIARTSAIQSFNILAQMQQRSKVDAIAVFAERGQLWAWAGEHFGRVPDSVGLGYTRTSFVEQPLYTYLYFSAPVPGRRANAVTALLLASALPEHAAAAGATESARLLAELGANFLPGPGSPRTWPLVVAGDTIAHARLNTITQAKWRDQTVTLAQRLLLAIAAVALLLIAGAGLRRPNSRLATAVPQVAIAGALAVAPIRALGHTHMY